MSFGLTNTPLAFIDLMNRLFQNYLDAFVISFNDIVVYSMSEGNHMGHLKVLLQVLRKPQLFSKYRKCEFWLRPVAFIGHIICCKVVEVNPRKTEMVKNYPRSLNPIEIRSFLGLAGNYRRFVDDFASISSPLTTLTQKSVKYELL